MLKEEALQAGAREHRTQRVREAFDAIAPNFDSVYENDATRHLRSVVYALIRRILPNGSSLLDVSCGTGIDLLALSSMGYRVAGSDLSPAMVQLARRKMEGHSPPINIQLASFEELHGLFPEQMDLVFSNFGALNCVADLSSLAREVASLVRPEGYALFVVMPSFSPWEIVAGFSRGRWKTALGRFRKTVDATGFSGRTFEVTYHSLSDLSTTLFHHFTLIHAQGMNIISPPPHARSFARKNPKLTKALEQFEERICSLPFLRGWGDHYLALFRRTAITMPKT